APDVPRPRRFFRRPFADRADARGARGIAVPDRHLLAACGAEQICRGGDSPLQALGARRLHHSADRRGRARRSAAGVLPAGAALQACARRVPDGRARGANRGRRAAPRRRQGACQAQTCRPAPRRRAPPDRAAWLGVGLGEIVRRAERARRRRNRFWAAVAGVFLLLAVAASGSAVYAWHELKTNEAFLNATLKTATDIVNTAVAQAEKYSVPRTATLELLAKAEVLFDDMARLGRPTPEL